MRRQRRLHPPAARRGSRVETGAPRWLARQRGAKGKGEMKRIAVPLPPIPTPDSGESHGREAWLRSVHGEAERVGRIQSVNWNRFEPPTRRTRSARDDDRPPGRSK